MPKLKANHLIGLSVSKIFDFQFGINCIRIDFTNDTSMSIKMCDDGIQDKIFGSKIAKKCYSINHEPSHMMAYAVGWHKHVCEECGEKNEI